MFLSQIPPSFTVPFASSAGGAYIRTVPVASQVSITPGAASYHDGFVALNAAPLLGGGVPPAIQDMNGVLYPITAAIQWLQAGGLPTYDAGLSAAIGGYAQDSILRMGSNNGFWISTADSNTSNPDTSGANWKPIAVAPGAYLDLSVAGSSNVTLTAVQAANSILDCGGVLTGNITVLIPAISGKWTFNNSTTGAYTLSIQMVGSGVVFQVQQGASLGIWADGINLYSSETSSVYNACPAGTIISYAGQTAPYGFVRIPVAPATVSRVAYTRLFASLGTTDGAGDGSTTFGIPYCPEGYALVNTASGYAVVNVGTVISHGHTTVANSTGTGTTGTGTSGSGNAAISTTNTDHAHSYIPSPNAGGAGSGGNAYGYPAAATNTGGMSANVTHTHTDSGHTHSAPALSVPALSIPSLTVSATGGSANLAASANVAMYIKY